LLMLWFLVFAIWSVEGCVRFQERRNERDDGKLE
jgi:hypothetical protein